MKELRQTPLKTLTIDRATWGKGENGSTFLDSHTGQMCVLGQYANAVGIPKKYFRGHGFLPADLPEKYVKLIPCAFLNEAVLKEGRVASSDLADEIMSTNDDDSDKVKGAVREKKLQKLFAKANIKLKFKGTSKKG